MTFCESSVSRENVSDHRFASKRVFEVEMSALQWAEMVSSFGGSGTACTFRGRADLETYAVERYEMPDSNTDKLKADLSDGMGEGLSRLHKVEKDLREAMDSKGPVSMYLGPNPLGVGLTTCVPDPELRHISHVEARTDRNKRKVTINPRGWHVVGLSGGFRNFASTKNLVFAILTWVLMSFGFSIESQGPSRLNTAMYLSYLFTVDHYVALFMGLLFLAASACFWRFCYLVKKNAK